MRTDAVQPDPSPSGGEPVTRLDLFVVSFLSLFLEITMIRWLPSQVRVLSYYANVALLSAFLGLAVGCLAADRTRVRFAWFPAILGGGLLAVAGLARLPETMPAWAGAAVLGGVAGLFLLVLGLVVRRTRHRTAFFALVVPAGILAVGLLLPSLRGAGGIRGLYEGYIVWEVSENLLFKIALVPLAFAVNYLIFFPVGVRLGRCFDRFPPLQAYTVNVAGSLLGVGALSAMAAYATPPAVWFAVAFACALFLLRRAPRVWQGACVGIAVAAGGLLLAADGDTLWSPYYNIRLSESLERGRSVGFNLEVNNNFHQSALDLRGGTVAAVPSLAGARAYYDLPYRLLRPASVLIVGAGTGNDAAAALRAGVARVDAVEIDPTIAALGGRHPEQPYGDPRVRLIVNDARSHFRTSRDRYDLIVFGLLDSHRLLSYLSSVRMDSYVYTRESLAEAARLLSPTGVVALSFCVARPWLGEKIALTIRQVAGVDPLIVAARDNSSTTFLFSPAPAVMERLNGLSVPPEMTRAALAPAGGVEIATDDWPYFYMKGRGISNQYLATVLALLVLSLAMLFGAVPDLAPTAGRFFWLGAAFMLLETRSITALSLLFGSTWAVNSLVIAAILAMILLANLLIGLADLRRVGGWYALLFAALALGWLVPLSHPYFSGGGLATLLAGLLAALPLLFAAMIFGISFRQSRTPRGDLGANLLGAVTGGLVEYASLVTGLQALYLLAAAFYGLSALRRRDRIESPASSG
jgi:SAM-dependent methyltransferase